VNSALESDDSAATVRALNSPGLQLSSVLQQTADDSFYHDELRSMKLEKQVCHVVTACVIVSAIRVTVVHTDGLVELNADKSGQRGLGRTCLMVMFLPFSFLVLFICPIAIAYSMGQIIKSFCVCACVCVCVHLWTLSRSHFFVDFHQIGHRRVNPQK